MPIVFFLGWPLEIGILDVWALKYGISVFLEWPLKVSNSDVWTPYIMPIIFFLELSLKNATLKPDEHDSDKYKIVCDKKWGCQLKEIVKISIAYLEYLNLYIMPSVFFLKWPLEITTLNVWVLT